MLSGSVKARKWERARRDAKFSRMASSSGSETNSQPHQKHHHLTIPRTGLEDETVFKTPGSTPTAT